jgi:hypothetical protein
MQNHTPLLLALITCAIIATPAKAVPDFGVNVYGFSYHLDRTDINGKPFNEQNTGFGFRAVLKESKKGVTFIEGGWFEDSFSHGACYLSAAYQIKITEGILLGMNVGYYDAPSVVGQVIAPIPTLTFRYDFIALNIIHMPGFSGLNPYPSFGGYLTVYLLRD